MEGHRINLSFPELVQSFWQHSMAVIPITHQQVPQLGGLEVGVFWPKMLNKVVNIHIICCVRHVPLLREDEC